MQCVMGKEWQGAGPACQMYYKFQRGPLGTTAVAETAALRLQYSLCISSLKIRGSLRTVAGPSKTSWRPLTYLCHSFELKAPLLPQWLLNSAILWEARVSVGLCLGQSWLSWCCEVRLPQSWVNVLQCWKTPGAWPRQSLGRDSRSRLAFNGSLR